MRHTLPDFLLSGLSDFVAARLGLHFPRERWRDLERGVAAAAREFGQPDAESCTRWLLSAPLARDHIETLASHLTIGESYFFREKQSLEIFEEHIIPELLHARQEGTRHLRIWCAGCSGGEEPYSIAMLLDRLLPDYDRWHITILATDINPQFLRKAAGGVYNKWSFRGVPEWIRMRYFKEREDGRFELSPHIRKRVTFSYLNLVDDVYPSLLNNTNAMDVIFCRNVLMYFTADKAKEAAMKFSRSLVKGGWLIVSVTETSNALFSPLAAVEFHGVTLYRRSVEPQQDAVAPAPGALHFRIPSVAAGPALAEMPQLSGATAVEPGAALPPKPDEGAALFASARSHANQGRLTAAVECCERAIALNKLNPAYHYLLAAIQQELGQADAAAQSLMRTLYLDSGFVLAHFTLANIQLSQSRHREANRSFSNALALLRTHPHEEILPGSDGLTAGRLAEIITSALASLPRAAAHA
ncbi:MAG: chemotaxis protein CheR [Gallionellaceae bacterium]|nr:chemotaxis protein CheR [Gallionellaceae bacterium]